MKRAKFYETLNFTKKALNEEIQESPKEFQFLRSKLYSEGVRRDIAQINRHMNSGNFLDFGCGMGYISVLCSVLGLDVHGIEAMPHVPSRSRTSKDEWSKRHELNKKIWRKLESHFSVSFKEYDGKILPHGTNSFEGVVAYGVVEHIADDLLDNAISEIWRVLKPEGFFFVFRTPRKEAYIEHIFRSHERLMGEEELQKLLTNSGFRILNLRRTDFFPAFLPGKAQSLLNSITPLMYPIQEIMDRLPTNYISHNMGIIAKKLTVHEEETKNDECL